MKKILLPIFLFFIAFEFAFSQKDINPGYLITLTNDTIHGFIDFRNNVVNSRKCTFYETPASRPEEFLPGEIQGYRIEDSRYFVTKVVKIDSLSKEVFPEFLVNGITNLYYLKDENGDHYFIEKGPDIYELTNKVSIIGEGDDLFFKESNKYKGMLMVIYSDAARMKSEIESAKFDRRTMIKLSEEYHGIVCTDRSCIVYEKAKKGVEFSIGPAVRYEWYKPGYEKFLGEFQIDGTESFMIGFKANLRLLTINEKMNIGLKTLIGHDYASGTFSEPDGTYLNVWHVDFRTEKLANEIDLIYKFPRGKLRPYAGIGTHLAFFLNNKTLLTDSRYDGDGNILNVIEKPDAIKPKFDIAFNSMLGFSYPAGRHSLFFELFYNIGEHQYTEKATAYEFQLITRTARITSVGITSGFVF